MTKPYDKNLGEKYNQKAREAVSEFIESYYGFRVENIDENYDYDLDVIDEKNGFAKTAVEVEVKTSRSWSKNAEWTYSTVDVAYRKKKCTATRLFMCNETYDTIIAIDMDDIRNSPKSKKECKYNVGENPILDKFFNVPLNKCEWFRKIDGKWVRCNLVGNRILPEGKEEPSVLSQQAELPHPNVVISNTNKKSNAGFVHWHCHSEYSALDGLSKMPELVMEARKMGFPALAITDHGTIGGWIKFIQECAKTKDKDGKDISFAPIIPILGCEFYLARNHEYKNKEMQPDGKRGNRHLNIFARNWEGYQNLCRLSQKAWIDGQYYNNPRIDLELLAEHASGLMVGTACLSSLVNANLLHDRHDIAKKVVAKFKDILGDHFFLEVMYHGIDEEGVIIPRILQLSKDMDVPAVATNDTHYTHKSQAKSQEVLMCMNTSKCINDENRMHFPYAEFYLKSAQEMASVFGDAPQSLTNSLAMLEHIDHKDIESNLFGHQRMPSFPVPEPFEKAIDYLRHMVMKGAKELGYTSSDAHMQRIEQELIDISSAKENSGLSFDDYFLIIWDIVNWAKRNNIMVGTGRGSGYASLVLRCLGVCYGPDPIKFGLLWERFLGFESAQFVSENDFGFRPKALPSGLDEMDDEDRELENDLGGVDRY